MTVFPIFLIFTCLVFEVWGHGYMQEPPQRSSLWRYYKGQGFVENYVDNQLFCGGFQVQWDRNGGKCGTCGDPYDGERKHEAGGIYATGFITRTYKKGQDIDVEINLTANHKGYFVFKLCPHNDIHNPVTQECLDRYVLEIAGSPGVTKYQAGSASGIHNVKLSLPADVICDQCVLQWHYNTGNSYKCDSVTGECCTGCGAQETFINCADIAINDDNGGKTTMHPPTVQTTTQGSASVSCVAINSYANISGMDDWCTDMYTCQNGCDHFKTICNCKS